MQPVVVEIEGTNLIVKFTKLEKNIKSYFAENRNPKLAAETNTEDATLRIIISHFQGLMGVSVNDFNQGIKHLWEADVLDCMKISYLDAFATVIYAMNGELTFKQQYPDKYNEMRNDPIADSLWKILLADENLLEAFRCNPTLGTLNINKFSDNPNQINNVITHILAQN